MRVCAVRGLRQVAQRWEGSLGAGGGCSEGQDGGGCRVTCVRTQTRVWVCGCVGGGMCEQRGRVCAKGDPYPLVDGDTSWVGAFTDGRGVG